MTAIAVATPAPPPAPAEKRGYSTAWWGMMTLIATEAMIFAILLSANFFLRAASKEWPLGGLEKPELPLTTIFSFLLWGSSLPIFVAESAVRRGDDRLFRFSLLLSFVMGAAFLGYTIKDFNDLHFGWNTNAYGSIFYTVVGLHAFHVAVGLVMSGLVQVKAWLGKFSPTRHKTVEVFALYWHFVDVVWLFVFPSMFLSVHWR